MVDDSLQRIRQSIVEGMSACDPNCPHACPGYTPVNGIENMAEGEGVATLMSAREAMRACLRTKAVRCIPHYQLDFLIDAAIRNDRARFGL